MRTIAPMHPAFDASDPLTGKLAGAMLLLMKGSQHEVMKITAELDLSFSQLRILFMLEHAGRDLAVNEIADGLSLSMAATGRAIDALHRTGLVSRTEDQADRRVKRIALTDEGTATTERIATARVAAVQAIVDRLDAEERAELEIAATTLSALVANHLPAAQTPCAAPTPPAGNSGDAGAAEQPAPARTEQTA